MPKKPSSETKLLRELAKILDEENLSEIEMEKGDLRLRVSRQISSVQAVAPVPTSMAPAVNAASPEVEVTDDENDLTGVVMSPMVGTVYLKPSPDDEAFVKIGDEVKVGETILLVEAMKTFNPIKANQSGVVRKIMVEDGQPVEFGEALLVIS